jgi:hypothetical protein
MIISTTRILVLGAAALLCVAAFADDSASDAGISVDNDNIILAQDRRDNRRENRDDRQGGRQDNRDDRQGCRQDEGRVGDDKRDCKQENRGEDDKAEADGGG